MPEFPPLSHRPLIRKRPTNIKVKTLSGELSIPSFYGQDPETKQWLNPMRMRLGLGPRQEEYSPELIERVCFTAVQAASYHSAERIARFWGVDVCDSTIQNHVRRHGMRIEERREEQVGEALDPATRPEVVKRAADEYRGEEFSLVIMVDGWMVRERGLDWGMKPQGAPGERVDWREMKTGIVFRIEDQATTQSGRGLVLTKYYEAWRGDPETFGQRLWALALSKGLYQARDVFVVADGAIWIWNLVRHRFDSAIETVDFYHVSEHLWAVAHALHGETPDARKWVEPLLSQLRHGQQDSVVNLLEETRSTVDGLTAQDRDTVEATIGYLQRHRERLDYQRCDAHGCPVGSGAIESTCSQMQDRFKRTGQYWTQEGARSLMALALLDRNEQWDEYWEETAA